MDIWRSRPFTSAQSGIFISHVFVFRSASMDLVERARQLFPSLVYTRKSLWILTKKLQKKCIEKITHPCFCWVTTCIHNTLTVSSEPNKCGECSKRLDYIQVQGSQTESDWLNTILHHVPAIGQAYRKLATGRHNQSRVQQHSFSSHSPLSDTVNLVGGAVCPVQKSGGVNRVGHKIVWRNVVYLLLLHFAALHGLSLVLRGKVQWQTLIFGKCTSDAKGRTFYSLQTVNFDYF